jgi:hypothetical protein
MDFQSTVVHDRLFTTQTGIPKLGLSAQKRTFTIAFRASRRRAELQRIRWLARPVLSGRSSARLHSFDAWAGNRKQAIQPKNTFGSDRESFIAAASSSPLLYVFSVSITCREARRLSFFHICHAASKESVRIWITDDLGFESVG